TWILTGKIEPFYLRSAFILDTLLCKSHPIKSLQHGVTVAGQFSDCVVVYSIFTLSDMIYEMMCFGNCNENYRCLPHTRNVVLGVVK
ncbi:MAG TPA: hypothetical protein VGQ53_25465, partial [Chitinophagaceae bacterium]|nr:hypothetical protein [Chitinophagaceae bacterium]